eukprot:Nk52_evm73s270 gene=Nk52_evmTU73s270
MVEVGEDVKGEHKRPSKGVGFIDVEEVSGTEQDESKTRPVKKKSSVFTKMVGGISSLFGSKASKINDEPSQMEDSPSVDIFVGDSVVEQTDSKDHLANSIGRKSILKSSVLRTEYMSTEEDNANFQKFHGRRNSLSSVRRSSFGLNMDLASLENPEDVEIVNIIQAYAKGYLARKHKVRRLPIPSS